MTDTPRLGMPELDSSSASKEITHNEALRIADVMCHLTVVSRTTSALPASASDGVAYIRPSGTCTGSWSEQSAGTIAFYRSNTWDYIAPKEGFSAWVLDEAKRYIYGGAGSPTEWTDEGGASWQPLDADLNGLSALSGQSPTQLGFVERYNESGAYRATYTPAVVSIHAEAGSAASPSVTVGPGDGLYQPGADELGFSTGGTHRALIDGTGRLVVGHTSSLAVAGATAGLELHGVGGIAATINARYANNANGPAFIMGKSRGATVGSYTTTTANDICGDMRFAGADGTDLATYGANLLVKVDGTVSTAVVPMRFEFWTMTAAGVRTLAAVVDSSQRVGIGTGVTANTVPTNRLTVSAVDGSTSQVTLRSFTTVASSGRVAGIEIESADTGGAPVVCAAIRAIASQDHSSGNLGTRLAFYASASSTATPLEVFRAVSIASAVNTIQFQNSATGNAVAMLAAGTDTDVGITLTPKGAGALTLGVATIDSTGEIYGYKGKLNAQTSFGSPQAYTLLSTDTGKIVTIDSAGAVTVILPNNLGAGFLCTVVQKGAGQITFSAASGATLNNRSSHTKSAGQWAVTSLYIDSNSGGSSAVYVLGGDTSS